MSGMTLRLPDALRAEATAYAGRLGVSLNALCAVALRDYLDARSQSPTPQQALPEAHQGAPQRRVERFSVEAGMEALAAVAKQAPRRQAAGKVMSHEVPAKGVYEPCPCGSGKKWKFCHGAA